ncbi:DNA repair protein rhp54 [Hordeum vulgare]|nr:DNA repair protein rhp54 [Hordeum vulgare]
MEEDFKAATAIASMASSVAAAEARGKARAPRKAVAPPKKKKKELTPKDRAVESAKRKGRSHTQGARGKASPTAAFAAVAQQEDINARVKAAMMEALLYLGVNPSQHRLVNAAVAAAAASTGSRFSEECLPEVNIVTPSTLVLVTIDLNTASVAGGSSSGGMRKSQREMPADMLTGARNLFDGMPAAVDNDKVNRFLENMIFEGVPTAGAYDPDETQSQDGRAPFTQATNDPHDAFMQDQVGLDGFPLDHEFPED